MAQALDIQEVIDRSTSKVSVQDLSRKGFKHVKVLNQATISRLVAEAVDKVLAERFSEISATERQKVIQESQKEFNGLAKERMREQAHVGKLEAENQSLRSEAELLRKRLDATMELQAERDQAVGMKASLEATLEETRARCSNSEKEVARLQATIEARSDNEQQNAASLQSEIATLRDKLSDSEKSLAKFEGQLDAKNEEIERLTVSAEEMVERVSSDLRARLESIDVKSGGDEELKKSLEAIQQNIATLSMSGGTVRKLDENDAEAMVRFAERGAEEQEVESNIANVEVKEAKAGGVKSSLARLKELQKGAQNDGE